MFEGVVVAGGAGRTSSGEYMRTTKAGEGGTQHVGEISRGARADKRTHAQHQRRVLAPAASAPHRRGAVLLVGGPRRLTERARRTKTPKSGLQCAHAHPDGRNGHPGAPGADADESPARAHPRAGRVAAGVGGAAPRAALEWEHEGGRFGYFYSLFRRASSAASTTRRSGRADAAARGRPRGTPFVDPENPISARLLCRSVPEPCSTLRYLDNTERQDL